MTGRSFRDAVESYGFLNAPHGRAVRGERIAALLRAFYRADLGALRLLDVGCSAGLMTAAVARHVDFAVGVDPDSRAIAHANADHAAARRPVFACGIGEALPFADETFDVVLCNHVYEHAGDPHTLMREIARVLRPDGACWFAAGHTWQLVEPHYRIPLLSLLPRRAASALVRTTGRGSDYSICFLPPWRLRELFAPFHRVIWLTPEILRAPELHGLVEGPLRYAAVRAAVRLNAPVLAWAAPTWHWLLFRR